MQKFFCDNCGTQVEKNALRCPKCGRYFKSVKCPKCGLAGNPDLFTNGCPSCGYAEERLNEGIDYFDIDTSSENSFGRRGRRKTHSPFPDRFYRRILPILILLFITLVILLVRTGW